MRGLRKILTRRSANTDHIRHREKGAGSVEFAPAAPVFFLLTIGAIDFGRALWLNHELDNLAREACRYAAVRSNDSDSPTSPSDVSNFIRSRSVSLFDDHLIVSTQWDGANAPGSFVQVDLDYLYQPVLGLLPIGDTTLVGTARMVISN